MQLLFNECIDIIKEHEDKVFIAITHAFHIPVHQPHQRITHYWTEKKNIQLLETLPQQALTTLPPEINFANKQENTSIVFTLTRPWYDSKTKQTYSAGTRFVMYGQSKNKYHIMFWDFQNSRLIKSHIPIHYGILQTQTDPKKRQQQFVQIARSWADQSYGIIPYVLGGCSFTQKIQSYNPNIIKNEPHYTYVEDASLSQQPINGFDCAGLVLRAAQCCGMPYFYKNTTTLAHFLQPLKAGEIIEEGDLIWIPGHVMIVSDLKKNLLIESRSFYHGYGKVQEIPLSEEFKEMHTYNDLKHAFLNQKQLHRLNVRGEIIQTITNFKILKLASIWK
jgi:cell wall-associated NlpC family hydrolase